jgi:hypothetical protein
MKTLSALALIAAFIALAVFPFVFEITASLGFAGGLIALVMSDYARSSRLVRLPAAAALALPARTERFGLAA